MGIDLFTQFIYKKIWWQKANQQRFHNIKRRILTPTNAHNTKIIVRVRLGTAFIFSQVSHNHLLITINFFFGWPFFLWLLGGLILQLTKISRLSCSCKPVGEKLRGWGASCASRRGSRCLSCLCQLIFRRRRSKDLSNRLVRFLGGPPWSLAPTWQIPSHTRSLADVRLTALADAGTRKNSILALAGRVSKESKLFPLLRRKWTDSWIRWKKNETHHNPARDRTRVFRWGLCEYVILRVQNETRWVARVLAGTFRRTWREDLCHFSVFTHQFVSSLFLFRAMENPPTSAAELDSDPDSPHLERYQLSLLWWSAAVSTGPVSLTAQPYAPSWRSTTWKKKGGVSIQILPLASHRYYGARQRQAVDIFPSGGFRGVADFVHGKMDGMHVWSTASSSTFEAFPRTRAFVFTLPWLFCILASQVFNFFLSDRHFSSDRFLFGSSWPFFHLCLLSFSVLSSKERPHIRLVVLFGNPCKTYQHQSVKRWNESPFSLPAEQLAHPNMYTQQVLTILKVLTGYWLALWRSTEKQDESSALATQCKTPCATRLSYHGICTILRAIRTIYVIRKGPIAGWML